MRHRTTGGHPAWFCPAAATALLVCGGGAAGDVEPKEKAQKIPLKSAYMSFKQQGMNVVKRGSDEAPGPDLLALARLWAGPSNIFLVRGTDVGEAAAATRNVLAGGHSADVP